VQRPLKRLRTQCLPSKRTGDLIKKVDRATETANTPTQNGLAQLYQVSRRTIQRILEDKLGAVLRKKTKTHALSNKQAAQRLERDPRFLVLINGTKWKYVISIDEAWLSLNDVNGVRDVFYQKEDKETPEGHTKKWKPKHEKKIMFAARICANGKTGI
jgi:hypothetical protein